MRHKLTGVVAVAVVLGAVTPMVYASVVAHPNYNHRSISVGTYSAGVAGIAAKDGNHLTEFMPIYYLEQGLKKNGFKVSWNGTTSSFNITTSQSLQVSGVSPLPGHMHIYINGVCVANAPKPLDAVDPASGKVTAYVPIYYFNKPLGMLGFTSVYNGTKGTWTVSQSAPEVVSAPGATWSDTSGGSNYLLVPTPSTSLPALSVHVGPDVQRVQFYIQLVSSNGPAIALGNPVTPSNNTASLPPTSLSATSLGGLFPGNNYSLYAVGTLADGSTITGPTTSFITYILHAAPARPSVNNTGYINSADEAHYTVSGTGISNMHVSVVLTDGGGHKVSGTAVVGQNGTWSTVIDTTPLVDGPITITATQIDSLGYRSAPSTGSVTKDTVAPTAPTNVVLAPVGGTVITNTLNQSNTDMTATADITAGQAIGGVAELYVGSTLVATDSNITASDTTVTFDLGTANASALEAMVPSGGAVTVKLYDAAQNASSSTNNPTLAVDYTPPSDENAVFAAPVNSIFDGESLTIAAPGTGETAWIAPAGITLASALTNGATMTSSTGATITVPSIPGTYYGYVTDPAGNVSVASTASFTVIAPNVDQLNGSGLSGQAGQAITFSGGSVIEPGETVFLAPSGTTAGALVANGATITEATSGNGSITAPTTAGKYNLFAVDSQGDVVVAANQVTVVPDSPVISNASTDYINMFNVIAYTVTGTGTSGDTVTVTLTDQNGKTVSGTQLLGVNGSFSLVLDATTLAQGPVQISAVQSSGTLTSQPSSVNVVDDTTLPSAPTNVQTMTGAAMSRIIDVTWTASTSTDVAGYYVFASTDGGATYTQAGGLMNGTGYQYSGSAGGQTVLFRIEAVDTHGNVCTPTSPVSGVTPASVAYKPVYQEAHYDPNTNTGWVNISVLDQYGQQINSASGITVVETQSDSDGDADDHTLTSNPTLTASTVKTGWYEMTFSQQLIDDYDHDSVQFLVVFTGPGGSDQWSMTF